MTSQGSSADLVQRIASGSESALGELYEATRARVHGLALALLGDPALAEEVLLEVYVQVWREAPRYERGRGNVNGWLTTLTRSRAIDMRRRLGRRPESAVGLELCDELAAAEIDPAEVSEQRDEALVLRRALTTIPAAQRRCLVFAFFRGQSHREVARTLDLPLGTVKTRIRMGLNALRRNLSCDGPPPATADEDSI